MAVSSQNRVCRPFMRVLEILASCLSHAKSEGEGKLSRSVLSTKPKGQGGENSRFSRSRDNKLFRFSSAICCNVGSYIPDLDVYPGSVVISDQKEIVWHFSTTVAQKLQ